MRVGKRTRTERVGAYCVEVRPNALGTNLADKTQPTILVSGPGILELVGRWTTLCGVPDGEGGTTTLNAMEATAEQIVYALTHDESIYA